MLITVTTERPAMTQEYTARTVRDSQQLADLIIRTDFLDVHESVFALDGYDWLVALCATTGRQRVRNDHTVTVHRTSYVVVLEADCDGFPCIMICTPPCSCQEVVA